MAQDIPIERKSFIAILRDTLEHKDQKEFERFATLLGHCCHCQFQEILNHLYASYKPFDASEDAGIQIDEAQEQEYARELINKIKKLLKQFQYEGLSEYDILDILSSSKTGLRVFFPLERYQEFLAYFQGKDFIDEPYRHPRTLWIKTHSRKISYYRKLVVLFWPFRAILKKKEAKALRHDIRMATRRITMPQPITLKLFQNIPLEDLPLIFPDIMVRMPIGRMLYWGVLLILTTVLFILGIVSFPWHALLALVPLTLFLDALYRHNRCKKHFYENFLSHFYYNSINNNQGVLSYLIEQTEDTTYKQILAVFHAFWRRDSWAFKEISVENLHSYFCDFFLEHCGVAVALNPENVLVTCGKLLNGDGNAVPPCLTTISASRAYLKADMARNSRFLDLKPSTTPFPRAGVVKIAPGTPKEEKNVFFRDPFLFHIEAGLKYSHSAGAIIRYSMEKALTTRLVEDVSQGSNCLMVSPEDVERLPLQGLGEISEESSLKFRYYRERNSNRLFLTTGLRYRHTPTPDTPVLVRPVLPHFELSETVPEGTIEIPLPPGSDFPLKGYVRLAKGTPRDFVTAYVTADTLRGPALLVQEKTPYLYEAGTQVSLTPPITEIAALVSKGAWFIPVKETRTFSKRGVLILSPFTDHEERRPFYREAFRLELNEPLHYSFHKGSFVQIAHDVRSKLVAKARRGSRFIMVHGFGTELTSGTIAISSSHNLKESREFNLSGKYLYLGSPTEHRHTETSEVWEAVYESPLRYEVLQGSCLIPVEDASSFPLQGMLEIYSSSAPGAVKEVFPFQRTRCSNTLLLSAFAGHPLKKGSSVSITAVEVTTGVPLHYGEKTIHAEFFCMPEFPEQGRLLTDPGSQVQEEVNFRRYPQRLYLKEPLRDDQSLGTALDFSSYAETVLTVPLEKNSDRIYLEYGSLLPDRGCLMFKSDGKSDTVWYRKLPHRVLLEKPCCFPHNLGSRLYFPGIDENVALASFVSKGDQQIKVINAQELPRKGRIKIQGLFRSVWTEFVREGDTLYLKDALRTGFSTRAHLKLPKVYLKTHLVPGSDYLEVSDPTLMPDSGKLVLKKAYHNKMYKQKNRHQESIGFKYCPDMLWLDVPLEKSYETGTVIFSPDLFIKGSGELKMNSMETSQKMLDQWLVVQLNLSPEGTKGK